MLNRIRFVVLTAMCVVFSSGVQSQGMDFLIGAEASSFDYRERDGLGSTLNRETGTLQGISAGLELAPDEGLGVEGIASVYGGTVDYRGATQAGSPLNTDTRERFVNGSLRLFYHFAGSHLRFSPFVGLGYRQWERSIQPTDSTLGLYEEYRWLEPEMGLQVRPMAPEWDFLFVRFSAYKIQSGRVLIDLNQLGFGEPELELGDKNGRRLSIGGHWKGPNEVEFRASLSLIFTRLAEATRQRFSQAPG